MSKKVWVVLQHRDGKLHRMSKEALAAGQRLAAEVGGTTSAVLLGSQLGDLVGQAAAFDLTHLYTVDDAALGDYNPGAYVAALAPAIGEAAPDFVVFPHTYQSVDYFPRLGQALDAALVPEVVDFSNAEGGIVWQRPILGGKLQAKVRVKGSGTVLLSVQSGAFPADGAQAGQAEVMPLPAAPATLTSDREILEVEQVGGDQVDLTKADVIVAIGRGVGGADKVEALKELARVLGADIGASRPVIDNGWLVDTDGNVERERQIGSSGQTVAPKLYIAAGISGAIQHLVGMKGASCIVAINKDATAPIFNIAQYGVVGDLHEIVPALTAAIREAQG